MAAAGKGTAKPRAGREVKVGDLTFTVWFPWGAFRRTLRELEALRKDEEGSSAATLDYMTDVLKETVRGVKGLKDAAGQALAWGPEVLDDYLTPEEVTDLFASLMNPVGDEDGNPSPA